MKEKNLYKTKFDQNNGWTIWDDLEPTRFDYLGREKFSEEKWGRKKNQPINDRYIKMKTNMEDT
jgi:hypothetical protein